MSGKPEQIVQKWAERLYDQINEHSEEIAGQEYCTYTEPNEAQRDALLTIYKAELQPLADLIRAAEEMVVAGGVETKARLNAHLKLKAALDKLAGE